MTHQHQSALKGLINELLDGNQHLERGEAQRRLLEAAMQELIEAEVTARIGAGRYERHPERVTRRNGTREKKLAPPSGTLELQIPGSCALCETADSKSPAHPIRSGLPWSFPTPTKG